VITFETIMNVIRFALTAAIFFWLIKLSSWMGEILGMLKELRSRPGFQLRNGTMTIDIDTTRAKLAIADLRHELELMSGAAAAFGIIGDRDRRELPHEPPAQPKA
jgi:hypothetical protein